MKSRGLSWLRALRLKVLAYSVVTAALAWGAILLSPAWAALPIVGVAVAAVTMTVSKMTSRLGQVTCWTCGADLTGAESFPGGVICERCGAVNQHRPSEVAVRSEDVRAWATLATIEDDAEAGEARVVGRTPDDSGPRSA